MSKNYFLCIGFGLILAMVSCGKTEADFNVEKAGLSDADRTLVRAAGFSTRNTFLNTDGTFTIEGDVQVTRDELKEMANQELAHNIIVGGEEHYTANFVVSTPGTQVRSITISLGDNTFPANYATALQNVINRYNNLNLRIKFVLRSPGSATNIRILKSDLGGVNAEGFITLGRASGFPTSNGNPAPSFTFNSNSAAVANFNTVTKIDEVLGHEIGHLIGFRHTDYLNRLSCGSIDPRESNVPSVGAIYIPGTVTAANVTATNSSWMMACVNGNAGFTNGDITALNFVY